MLKESPFHARTSALCKSFAWKEWAGYAAVCNYDRHSEREYFAIRSAAALLDATPLYKYEVTGKDAAALLARVWCRDVHKLKSGRVTYSAMCDARGKTIDDGTIARLAPEHYRMATSEPHLHWLVQKGRGLDVHVEDSTDRIGCLALQGPFSRHILSGLVDLDLDAMRFFAVGATTLRGVPIELSRTGYTGDLGYEIWVAREHALRVWDAVIEAGVPYGLEPIGLDALDVARIEAGFVLQGVDYISARKCITESRKSSPFEAGLGWTVDLDRDRFIGQEALRAEIAAGPRWDLVGLELSWPAMEKLHEEVGIPPHLSPTACRLAVPVYDRLGRQVGQCTSSTWSPLLKRYIALAQVHKEHAATGSELRVEYTVDYQRKKLPATVAPKPFFDPPRKRETPSATKRAPTSQREAIRA